MATAAINVSSLSLHSFIVLFFFFCSLPQIQSASSVAHVHTVHLDSLPSASTCTPYRDSINKHENSSVLQLISRFGPCSPIAYAARTRSIPELLQKDQVRASWIQLKASVGSKLLQSTLPAYSGTPLDTLEFIVLIGLGTPKQTFQVLFDTGSDVTWVQCEPCLLSCHPQLGPRFSPSKSSTYQYYSCNSAECNELVLEGDLSGCASSRCLYGLRYGDGSTTIGYFGRDTLTLTSSAAFSGFPFGCGENNTGLFGKEAGLLGLGRNKLSLVSLTSQYYGGVFSYCLPTSSSPGFLTFGSDTTSGTASFTPLLTNPQAPSFYFVSLLGLSVGGKLLPVPSSLFSSTGTILDSGTVLTYLPTSAYAALRSAFQSSMSAYPRASPSGNLDTCYDFSGYSTVRIPVVAFIFQGGTKLVLDFGNIMIRVDQVRYCLAFAPTTGIGIIGNWQQRKTQIVYDIANSRIGFRPNACS